MIVTSREANSSVKLVLQAIETVFDGHDVDAIDEFFAPDFVQHSPYAPPGGKRELAEWWRRTVDAMPDIRGRRGACRCERRQRHRLPDAEGHDHQGHA